MIHPASARAEGRRPNAGAWYTRARAVIDSLSTYGSSLGAAERSFRNFFHAIVALMNEHQVTAVYNHGNPEMLGMSSMMGEVKGVAG